MSIQTIDSQAAAFFSRFQPVKVNGKSLARSTREEAAAALEEMTIPTRKWEDWKYTNLAPLVKRNLNLAGKGEVSKEEVQARLIPELDSDYLVFVNGYFAPELSDFAVTNYHVNTLHDLEGMERELFEAYFGQIVPFDQDVFTAMNTAYGREGLFVYVPKAKMIEKPLQVLHITTGSDQDLGIQHRNMFLIGEGASLKIIESYHTLGETTSFRNDVTEIRVEDRAQFEHIRLQIAGNEASQVNNLEIHQGRDSIAKTFVFTMSGDLIRNNLIFKLKDEHTESHLMGAYLLDGTQKLDNFTQVNHMKPHCFSNELYKGIMDDEASGAFTGRINVFPDAQKTNAYQSNRNILLSDDAQINTKPQLEIYADDVKCSHGATTGRLDEEALFYLMARGINKTAARKLLVHAFVLEVSENISLEPVRQYIDQLVSTRY